MPKPDESSPPKGIRLRHLKVRNFKVLDDLDLELPPPQLPGDPDVLVLGSRNGCGKTSVLEACALLLLGARGCSWPEFDLRSVLRTSGIPVDVVDLVIRAGQNEARMEGEFDIGESVCRLCVSLLRPSSRITADGDIGPFNAALRDQGTKVRPFDPFQAAEDLVHAIAGLTAAPFVCPPVLYFHSYRRVKEGNTELGGMAGLDVTGREPISSFKLTILRSMMGQKGLLEGVEKAGADETIEKLNSIMREYAGGTMAKLRTSHDNTIEFRVSCGEDGASFTFDGLSSGQKEIISTFFLIWLHTHASPGIVLIDEPELHLNAEWQVGIIRRLFELVPGNQLIIATHSQDVFGSVEPSRRVILEAGKGAGHGRG